jgi:small subunit ribosomal protein S17
MADETDNDTPETEQDAPEQAPTAQDAGTESAQADAPAEPAGEESAQADAAASEPEQTPEADAGETEDTALAPAPAPPAEPVEIVPPKERRRRARSKHTDARPSRTPEERHAERLAERKTKAVRRRARRLQERAKAATRRAAAPAPQALAPVHAPVEGTRRVRQGIVVSDKADKTITVRIDVARRHRRYEKIVRSSSTVHAHDENNDAHEGDTVRVVESRPLSRTKRWALVDVLERAR